MKFSKGDITFTVSIFAGIAILSLLLYFHMRERGVGAGKPIGKVFFKHEVALRKFSDRMVWEDVENGTPLYAQDSVMTGNLSDAELVLESGLKLKLEANTLVELDLADQGMQLKLSGGGIKASGVDGQKTMVTTASGQQINLGDASAIIRTTGKDFAVEVAAGKVQIQTKDGASQTISRSETYSQGKKSVLTLAVTSPAEGKIYVVPESAQVPVECSPLTGNLRAELSGNNSPAREIKLPSGRAKVPLGEGDWVVKCLGDGNAISGVRKFRVVAAGRYKIYRPEKQLIEFRGKPVLRVEFKPPQGVLESFVTVSRDASFGQVIAAQKTSQGSIDIPVPSAGKYYFKVEPSDSTGNTEFRLAGARGMVDLAQAAARIATTFRTHVEPVFSRSQVDSSKAIIAFDGTGEHRVVVQSRDKKSTITERKMQPGFVTIPPKTGPGAYMVVLTDVQGNTVQQNFRIRESMQVQILAPKNNAEYFLYPGEKTTSITLSWRGSAEINAYQVVLAQDSGFREILKKTNVEGTEFRLTAVPAGTYYAKVLALENQIPRAESQPVTIAIKDKLQPVAPVFPRENQKVDVAKSKAIPLAWKPVVGATAYEVRMYQRRHGRLVLVDTKTSAANSIRIGNVKKFSEGEIIWEISAIRRNSQGKTLQKSPPVRQKMQLSFGPPPPPPEIVPVISE